MRKRLALIGYIWLTIAVAAIGGYTFDRQTDSRNQIRDGVAQSFADGCNRGNDLRGDIRTTLNELIPAPGEQQRVIKLTLTQLIPDPEVRKQVIAVLIAELDRNPSERQRVLTRFKAVNCTNLKATVKHSTGKG